jgi:hypothetical protein
MEEQTEAKAAKAVENTHDTTSHDTTILHDETVTISKSVLDRLHADHAWACKVLQVYANEKNWRKFWDIGTGKYAYAFNYADGTRPAVEVMEIIGAQTRQDMINNEVA